MNCLQDNDVFVFLCINMIEFRIAVVLFRISDPEYKIDGSIRNSIHGWGNS